jgi:ABC-type multidrug transport system fused ATPase/permease subunit
VAKSFGPNTLKRKISWHAIKGIARMYLYIKPFQSQFMIGMVFLILSSLTALAFPTFLGDLVDAAQSSPEKIDKIALNLGLLLLSQSVFSFFRILFFERVAQKSLSSLRQAMYSHLIDLPMNFFHSKRVGELTNRLQSDIGVLQETFTSTLAEFIRQIVIISGGVILLAYTSVKLTLFMLAVLPFVIILAIIFGTKIRKLSKSVQDASASSNVIVEQSLSAIATVKAFTNENSERKKYEKSTDKVAQLAISAGILRGGFASFLILGLFGALVLVVWKGTSLISSGELDPGQLFSFVIYSGFIGGSMGGIADVYGRLQKAIGATEGIVNILEEKIEENSSNQNLDIDIKNQKSPIISFQNVDFAYASRSDLLVLQSLNLDVLPGDQLAIVGPSGAGKSTIMQLLLRFQVPTSGEIYFFGEKSSSYSKNFIRKQMGWVPQDVILFGQSIRENILYGNIKSTEDDLMSAVKESNSFEFIDKFPNGLDTEIGERGVQLSGGQRQRIAIARAMLKDPQVLLLDEATSSLDAENESVVQEALDRLMKNKTSVIIAHRLSTVRNANKIAFLNEGRVLELGSHEELMNLSSGSYKKFVNQQLY